MPTSSRIPGVPTVYWKHYFDWGPELGDKIRALINARKVAGVHAGSACICRTTRVPPASMRRGSSGATVTFIVRIGGDDAAWQPFHSGYQDYREYAQGAGWKVWVGLPGNPELQAAPLRAPLPIPLYREPQAIDVPDHMLN